MTAPASRSSVLQSALRNPRSVTGFSVLDLLITLLVLTLVLLAAVKQFSVYHQPAQQPAPPAPSAPPN